MRFSTVSVFDKRPVSDLLVVPMSKQKDRLIAPSLLGKEKGKFEAPIQAGDFKGEESTIALLYSGAEDKKSLEKRALLLGLGEIEEVTAERLRRSFSVALKEALRLKVKTLTLLIPEVPSLSEASLYRGICEGLLLPHYTFHLKEKPLAKESTLVLKHIVFITPSKQALVCAKKALTVCEAVYLARDLVNGNADEITPSYLAKFANKLAEQNPKIHTTVLDRAKLEKEGLGLLLAVGRGAVHDPLLILTEYRGNPKSTDTTVLVGKGVTFDTGGLNLKPTGSMETMKCDMGGAAAVLATVKLAAELGLKQNVIAVVPTAENAIGSGSFKPGDVYQSYAGLSVEVINTDAEGRLILADALAYAVKKLKPSRMIDVATLTGACEIALGSEASGLFSSHDALADSLIRAGSETFERLWRLPFYDEFKELLRSDIADLKNHGGRAGGASIAALFLSEFAGSTPWAHLDIAGTAYFKDPKRYHPRFATGVGVRLLIEFLEHL